MKNHQRVVAIIPKGVRDVIRVTETVIDGQTFIDIRKFRPYGLNMYRPTDAGLSLRSDVARDVAVGILAALSLVPA